MKPTLLLFSYPKGTEQNLVVKESPLINVFVNKGEILVDDATGAKNHMPDFRVPHLTIGQSHVESRDGNARCSVTTPQRVHVRHRRVRDSIAFFSRVDAKSIQDEKDHGRLFAHEILLSS